MQQNQADAATASANRSRSVPARALLKDKLLRSNKRGQDVDSGGDRRKKSSAVAAMEISRPIHQGCQVFSNIVRFTLMT